MTEAIAVATTPVRNTRLLRRVWHVLTAGSFLVAFLVTDDSSFGNAHIIAGYLFLGLLALRIAAGLIKPTDSAFALPLPSLALFRRGESRRGRPPVLGWLGAILLVAVLASAVSGIGIGDDQAALARHTLLSDVALGVATAHIAIITLMIAA